MKIKSEKKQILGWVFTIISFFILSEYYLGRITFGQDQLSQHVAGKHFFLGNGFTTPVFNNNDLAQPSKIFYAGSPHGSVLALYPFLFLSSNVQVIHTAFIFITLLVFVLLLFKILSLLLNNEVSFYVFSLILLFLSLNGSILLLSRGPDLICLNIYLMSGIFLLQYYRTEKKIIYLLLACFVIPFSLFFRYAYFPSLFVLPAFFLCRMIFSKRTELKELIISSLSILVFSLPFLLYLNYMNENTSYIESVAIADSTKLFYWKNLITANPFPYNAFFDLPPSLRLLGFNSEFGYDRGYQYPLVYHFMFFAISIVLLLPVFRFYKVNDFGMLQKWGYFSFLFSLGLIIFLYIGSVLNPSQYESFNWSWSKVYRYYLIPVFFIQITYLIIALCKKHYSYKKNWMTKKSRQLVITILILSFSFSFSLKLYNYTINYKPFAFWHNLSVLRENDALFNSYNVYLSLLNTDKKSVAIVDSKLKSHFDRIDLFLAQANIANIYADKDFNYNLRTSSPIIVYYITSKNSETIKSLKKQYNLNPYSSLENSIEIFSFTLPPNT